jgi:hypothetical protein
VLGVVIATGRSRVVGPTHTYRVPLFSRARRIYGYLMSRCLVYVFVLWMSPGGAIRQKGLTRKGRAGRVLWQFQGSNAVAPPVSVKDRAFLAPMASLELCTDHMSGFTGPDKPSGFCSYYVNPHLPALCGAFTFGGRMRPRAKTSTREQGPDFDIVGTCERLSYVRASRSQAYGMSVRFFPCRVYINSSHRDTLGY